MRDSVGDFVRICAETLPLPEPVYEFGAYQVAGQREQVDLRSFFPNRVYVGADMREGPGVDVVLNLHSVDLPAGSVGTVLLLDTLEHVELFGKALEEIRRILRQDGVLVMSSVMNFPIHAYPCDYWRFTPDAFRSLLAPFAAHYVTALGRQDFPHTVVGVGFKSPVPDDIRLRFEAEASRWSRRWRWRIFTGWKEWVRRLTPPILIESYMQRRIRRESASTPAAGDLSRKRRRRGEDG